MKHQWVIRIAAAAGLVAAGVVFARWEPPAREGEQGFALPRESEQDAQLRQALSLLRQERHSEAIGVLIGVIRAEPRRSSAWLRLSEAYGRRGETDDAERAEQALTRFHEIETRAARRNPSASAYRRLGLLRQRTGYPGATEAFVEAVSLQRRFLERTEDPPHQIAVYNLACYEALAGQREAAVRSFLRAAELGFRDTAHIAADRDLDSIRDDPRFRAAVEAMRTRE